MRHGQARRPNLIDYLQQFMIPRIVTENTLRRGFAPSTDEMMRSERP